MRIIYKPGPELLMKDWLSRHNHSKNKDKEITDMQTSINLIQFTANVPGCITVHELQEAKSQDQHLKHHMNMSYKGGLTANTNYHKTSEHTGHSETTWQLLMG